MGKKVGIVSCYFKNNYGSMLQAYATQRILDNNKIPNETINVDNNIDFKKGKRKYYLTQITNFDFIKSKFGMIKLKLDKRIVKDLGKDIEIRNNKYKEFRKEFNLSKSVTTYEELNKMTREKYTDIIVGSDQLWLPVNVVADYYTLNWVPDEVNKISYSTSFGVSTVPDKYNERYKCFLKRINHLSIREDSGIKLAKRLAEVDGKLVCDPTLLLTKEEWEEIATKERVIEEKYILCYFLGSNIEHRKFAERLREITGYKIVSLNHADEYVKYSDKYCDYAPFDIGPREWINLIKNAEYVCTDSFHGTVFSLIFNKTFFNFRRYNAKAKASTNSRLDSLLKVVQVSNERILTGKEDVEDVLKFTMDFDSVNKNLTRFREESKKWLLDSISYKPQKEKIYIEITDKELCCGCTACKCICPKNAIEMIQDEEGFLYPKVNKEECIECGKCKDVCPVRNSKEIEKNKHAYIFQHKNDNIRQESTSGGAFTAIAEYILNRNGIVYGVVFDKEYNVIHLGIENKRELYRFRNSKYVQSNPLNTFKEIKYNLEKNRFVCFSGTSCQVEGLKKYLGKEYERLILVDIVCRAVPSPLVWKKYLNLRQKEYNNISKIIFRDKYYGYKYSNLSIYNKDNNEKKEYHSGIETDPYLRAFFSNICDRPSCYECKFKKGNRESDITLWDCFEVEKYNKKLDDDKGTTRILTNSIKGNEIVKEIGKENILEEITYEQATKGFLAMFKSVKNNARRNEFFSDVSILGDSNLFEKYFPNTFKCKVEKYARLILIKLGIYKPLLNLGKKIRKRD